ncbi:tripartite tricarboxylate transporter substrate binding protein [Afifella pfennigii]|uniref:tripartite tricarboxylate transporter substrate binding protein n=1 Tax=Afifella pfennigii TaxID=209897 RepID=UPI000479F99C|nr:tripartite tricarboxylate transporter substrate binding protein [Afifella pfennigii]
MKAWKRLLALGALGALLTGPALAQYPERPVTLVIPYGAGGATDISARALAGPLGKLMPKPLLTVNRTGAGGATGSVSVANADPDGYTMLAARVGSHTVNPAMKATLPYTLDDFVFVGVYEINPVVCAVAESSDIQSMDDLIAKAKAEPGSVSFSSSGVGSLLHLAGAMVLNSFGVENPLETATHIPLKGGGEAATAVLAGTATFICTNSSALASFVANEQLRPLLVTTPEPLEGFDAPTASSLGHEELEQLVGWTGIAGPKGLPDEVSATWRDWLSEATADETFVDQMTKRGSVIRLMDPQESQDFINGQYETFRKLVDDLDMRIEG